MKKLLLSLMVLGGLYLNGQATQKISFETSEGYNLGTLDGQNGWTLWSYFGGFTPEYVNVNTAKATDGTNSFYMESLGEDYLGGIEKNISSMTTGNDTEISFDYLIDALDGSDYGIDIYNDTGYLDKTATFSVDYETGTVSVTNGSGVSVDGPTIAPNQWYNFKVIIRKSTSTLEYYINGALVNSSTLDATINNAAIIDFTFDDYDTVFYVDNLKITNLSALGTSEVSKKDAINVYPNPAVDKLNIESKDKINSIVIFDAKGGAVKNIDTVNSGSVNVSDLTPGVYLVKVKTSKSEFTKKFIKK